MTTTKTTAGQTCLDLLRESFEAGGEPQRWEFAPLSLEELQETVGPRPWGNGAEGPTFLGFPYDVGPTFPGITLVDLREAS